ncbi:TRL domain-containing protein [Leptospira adleri]|uniref:TRL-like family protein n=1 Tax=Leptospira adleri TaxID=2023186 RepID=A0A2M9YSV3_9LEPT|nr:TRL domain-containing protein [Leptospira adleri]PJZ54612.1 TRL-like family protein [Leptospira adleri]PJZ59672.1 TRL-like family protein [Leptospira adleri]
MKKIIISISIFIVAMTASNCASSLYPTYLFHNEEYHVSGNSIAGPGDAKILKQGRSCNVYSIFSALFYAGGEGSVAEAMKDGNITKVAVIDKSSEGFLAYLYSKECVIVYGE